MAEPKPDASEVGEAEETVRGFVVAGCQPAAVFQLVEAALNHNEQDLEVMSTALRTFRSWASEPLAGRCVSRCLAEFYQSHAPCRP